MDKFDNEWKIEFDDEFEKNLVKINGEEYYMSHEFAGLAHAILLLVDAVNDKRIK